MLTPSLMLHHSFLRNLVPLVLNTVEYRYCYLVPKLIKPICCRFSCNVILDKPNPGVSNLLPTWGSVCSLSGHFLCNFFLDISKPVEMFMEGQNKWIVGQCCAWLHKWQLCCWAIASSKRKKNRWSPLFHWANFPVVIALIATTLGFVPKWLALGQWL